MMYAIGNDIKIFDQEELIEKFFLSIKDGGEEAIFEGINATADLYVYSHNPEYVCLNVEFGYEDGDFREIEITKKNYLDLLYQSIESHEGSDDYEKIIEKNISIFSDFIKKLEAILNRND